MSELRVYDLRNRFMSPELGRFLQPDPIGFTGDASNLYRYCHNDPEDFSDPMGLVSTSATDMFNRLTSFGGGDWINGSDGLSIWDRTVGGMPSNRWQAGMENNAGGGKDQGKKLEDKRGEAKTYKSFNEAAAAQEEAAYKLMSRTHEAGTEIWRKDDGSANFRSDKPRVTSDKLYDINDGKEKGKFLGFEADPGRHPKGYHIAGWMYAHPFYRPEVPPHDQRRAFERGWNVYLVTPIRADRRMQNATSRNVVTYTYPDKPTD